MAGSAGDSQQDIEAKLKAVGAKPAAKGPGGMRITQADKPHIFKDKKESKSEDAAAGEASQAGPAAEGGTRDDDAALPVLMMMCFRRVNKHVNNHHGEI